MGYIVVCLEPEQIESGEIYVQDARNYTANITRAAVYKTREEAEVAMSDNYNEEEIKTVQEVLDDITKKFVDMGYL